jgi:hypothetical protein
MNETKHYWRKCSGKSEYCGQSKLFSPCTLSRMERVSQRDIR